jgi:ubiquinone/menaquinone biosynthesis C-methylase UbiE
MDKRIEDTIKVYDQFAKDFANFTFPRILQYQISQFLSHLPKHAKILDVACGAGRDVQYFMEEGYDPVGIDASKGMINEAKSRVVDGNFKQMDMLNLEFDENSFDAVWCMNSLLHIPKDLVLNALKNFFKVLKPSGVLFLAVQEGEGERFVNFEKSGNLPRFFAFYNQAELENLLEEAGFTIVTSYNEEDEEVSWINVLAKKI